MKPEPAPYVPGNTESERFSNAVSRMFTVSKADLLKREEKWKKSDPVRSERRNPPDEPACHAVT